MKKLFFFQIIIIILGSCTTTYVQLYKTSSVNISNNERSYKFENDSIEIRYSFWADKGIMSFSIYNKLSTPIYIDWKKSNFISNSFKFNYWYDEERMNGASAGYGLSSGYSYKGPLLIPYLTIYESASATVSAFSSIKVKPERITFIPPKSIIYKSPYFLTGSNYPDMNSFEIKSEPRLDKPKKKSIIYFKTFSKNSSPIVFRNFITYSLAEDFKDEHYIDNEFYVSEIDFIDKRHFDGYFYDENANPYYKNKFQKGIDFYRK